jgi:hypothetical protein
LPELSFIKWSPSRFLNSSLHLLCNYEVQGVARALFDISTQQSPIGTLPRDDEELAALVRLPMVKWRELRALGERGPLRNWRPCLCTGRTPEDSEVRLYHPVILSTLEDVLNRREERERSRGQDAEGKRLKRLGDGMVAAGLSPAQAQDAVLMARIDAHLLEVCHGNRRAAHYQAAFEFAVRQGWV